MAHLVTHSVDSIMTSVTISSPDTVFVNSADIAYCKSPYTGRFHCFDDEEVRDIPQGSIKVC